MNKEKGAAAKQAPSSTSVASDYTPRLKRLIAALRSGPQMRESLDRAIGASNSPHYVMELRRMDFDIACERLDRRDRDGRRCRPGRYTLLSEPEGVQL